MVISIAEEGVAENAHATWPIAIDAAVKTTFVSVIEDVTTPVESSPNAQGETDETPSKQNTVCTVLNNSDCEPELLDLAQSQSD